MTDKICQLKGCNGKLKYHDGALGYEAMVCKQCGAHYTNNGIFPKKEEAPCQSKEDTKDIILMGKGFHFETRIDQSEGTILSIHLTEFGRYPDEIEMLEAYDFYPEGDNNGQ